MSDATGTPERAVGKAHGRVFTVRRSLLDTLEGTLSTLADKDAMDRLDPINYVGMSQERVKIQLTVFRSEVEG